ncbi:hypothetical protein [Bifidobacterium aemilianum]|nr:hypothetical protein [Bifidobacterium aemilianum]
MTWTWGNMTLEPGECLVIKLPLQVGTGQAATQTNQITVAADKSKAGLPSSTTETVCDRNFSGTGSCKVQVRIQTHQAAKTELEKYVDAGGFSDTLPDGSDCDVPNRITWGGSDWVKSPCHRQTTPGEELTYRIKAYNAGSSDTQSFRVVDELPMVNDKVTVVDALRGTTITPEYVQGSARVLADQDVQALGARDDVSAKTEYTSATDPCAL